MGLTNPFSWRSPSITSAHSLSQRLTTLTSPSPQYELHDHTHTPHHPRATINTSHRTPSPLLLLPSPVNHMLHLILRSFDRLHPLNLCCRRNSASSLRWLRPVPYNQHLDHLLRVNRTHRIQEHTRRQLQIHPGSSYTKTAESASLDPHQRRYRHQSSNNHQNILSADYCIQIHVLYASSQQ